MSTGHILVVSTLAVLKGRGWIPPSLTTILSLCTGKTTLDKNFTFHAYLRCLCLLCIFVMVVA